LADARGVKDDLVLTLGYLYNSNVNSKPDNEEFIKYLPKSDYLRKSDRAFYYEIGYLRSKNLSRKVFFNISFDFRGKNYIDSDRYDNEKITIKNEFIAKRENFYFYFPFLFYERREGKEESFYDLLRISFDPAVSYGSYPLYIRFGLSFRKNRYRNLSDFDNKFFSGNLFVKYFIDSNKNFSVKSYSGKSVDEFSPNKDFYKGVILSYYEEIFDYALYFDIFSHFAYHNFYDSFLGFYIRRKEINRGFSCSFSYFFDKGVKVSFSFYHSKNASAFEIYKYKKDIVDIKLSKSF